QSVASATEELSSSVTEIGRQVQESARMATDAVGQARVTNDRVSQLSKAASRIGDVVELINTIAGQTNLLALNATIEAARAGDAGNFAQRAAGCPRNPAGFLQHLRRAARCQRDRRRLLAGALGGAVAVGRQPSPQARGRQVSGLGAGGLTAAWRSAKRPASGRESHLIRATRESVRSATWAKLRKFTQAEINRSRLRCRYFSEPRAQAAGSVAAQLPLPENVLQKIWGRRHDQAQPYRK